MHIQDSVQTEFFSNFQTISNNKLNKNLNIKVRFMYLRDFNLD